MEAQLRRLGPETVKAVVEHICQSLPTADGGYCNPLVFDYVRALVHLLEYRAHVENLPKDELQEAFNFCVDLARDLNRASEEEDLSGSLNTFRSSHGQRSHSGGLGRSATPSVAGTHGVSFRKDGSYRMMYPQLQSSAGGIVLCLQHLASVPCAPVLDKADSMLDVLFNLLQTHPNVSTLQQPAFETINGLIPRILTSNTDLALRTMRHFVALVRSFWQTRASGLKEVLLSIFLHGESILPLLISRDDSGNCSTDLSAVVEVLRLEYCERRPKEQLLIEDVDLSDYSRLSRSRPPLHFKFSCIRQGAIKAEEPWSLLRISAAIIVTLDQGQINTKKSNGADEHDHRSKRQRLTKPLDELRRFIKDSGTDLKVYGLQVLAFVFDSHTFDETTLLDFLELIGPSLSDEDGTVASWAMFAIAWLVKPVQPFSIDY